MYGYWVWRFQNAQMFLKKLNEMIKHIRLIKYSNRFNNLHYI